MNNQNRTLVPALRFPEFKNAGEWEEKYIKETFNHNGGKSLEKYVCQNGKYHFISIGNYSTDGRYIDDGKHIILNSHTKDKLLHKNEFVMLLNDKTSKGDIIGSTILIEDDDKYIYNQRSERLILKINLNCKFVWYLLNSIMVKKQILNIAQGGTQIYVNYTEIEKILLSFPSIPEQQRIASCLSSLDELIAANSKKLELLKAHKKGLLQNLFPQNGEKIPKYRFPEFKNAGEWEEKKLGEVTKVTTGKRDTQNKVDNGKYPFFVRSQTVERINSYSFEGEAILTSGDGVGVGKNFHYINGKFDFHQRVYCIYNFSNDVSGKFIFMYFSQYFYKRIIKMSAKNSVDSVRMSMITEMPISLPSKQEQQRIASCLSSLDNLISAQSKRIEQLQLHKKGLMQGLFPKENQ